MATVVVPPVPKLSRDQCNDPACSAFRNVSLVLGVTAAERVPWLLDYALWFASVHFMVPERECDDCQCYVRQVARAHRRLLVCDCAPDFNTSLDHAASTEGMRRAAADAHHWHGQPVRGVLFAHMDMWINVRSFQVAPFDAMWMPHGGLLSAPGAPYCAASGPTWHKRVPGYITAQTPSCREGSQSPLLPSLRPPQPGGSVYASEFAEQRLAQCCFGWADMYYVPLFALDAFAKVSRFLSRYEPPRQ